MTSRPLPSKSIINVIGGGRYMPWTLPKCGIRKLSRSLTTIPHGSHHLQGNAEAQRALARYPIFNLNDESGRHLGPRRGDEAILTLSGGVDSSVAAYLAVKEGGLQPYKTIFMRNWNSLEESEDFEPGSGGSQGCQWQRDWDRVSAMAKWLGVEPELMDLSSSYWNCVFSPSLDEWARGLTPNPDIMCNREIKFGELLRRLDDADPTTTSISTTFGRRRTKKWLVTGHYAGLEYYFPSSFSDSLPLQGRLYRAKDHTKDQSYFLSAVTSEQLGRTHFPLSHISKVEARQLARTLGMPTAESEESMGLCFVGERRGVAAKKDKAFVHANSTNAKPEVASVGGFAGFLGDYIESRPGEIITMEGKVLGKHNGLHTLTIGQGARIGGVKERHFVAAKRAESNQVVVVPGSDHPWLLCHALQVSSFRFIATEEQDGKVLVSGDLLAQIRHRQSAVPCKASKMDGDKIKVEFESPILSVAEGQVCALYSNQRCIGSGTISSVDTKASSQYDEQLKL